ncbi:ankyrin repeat domain-containing protein [Salinibacter ruber]|uniref:ankyrin repeat domain-containing protein n=1 Tax=Salinibacter ruber TaxID=146919 RepID=UPI0021678FDB|nr:ankyrin repeat domain-containing protein [Salinibacter ruber]MCS3642350.1 ankyrin repeat protein [Salinibacter ruber]
MPNEDDDISMTYATLPEERRDTLIKRISRYYPLTEEMIDQYPLLWNWEKLSGRKDLPWTEELIARHEDRWHWSGFTSLSWNDALPWSEVLIARFEDRWDWERLTKRDLPWSEDFIARFEERWDWSELSYSSSRAYQNEPLPWSEELVERFEEQWDWGSLSKNEALPWSEEFIARYEERWTKASSGDRWMSLSDNEGLPWNKELIERFKDQWYWRDLSRNEAIPWSEELIARYEDRWTEAGFSEDWEALSGNEALPWSEELIARYEDQWDWEKLSENDALPWSEELIARYEDQWDWEGRGSLSENEALPWSEELIARFEERWDWERLSEREDLPWSEDFVERFEDQWSWGRLSKNEALPWSEELIAQHEGKWNWEAVSKNEILFWSEDLIARYEDRWDWQELSKNKALPWSGELIARYEDKWEGPGVLTYWKSLSANEALPWSRELIERFEDQWSWRALSRNGSLPWSEELIAHYEDRWRWKKLSSNESLQWSEEFIARYEDRWDWKALSGNRALPPSRDLVARFVGRWDWGKLRSELITECISPKDIQQTLAAASSGFTFSEERQRLHEASKVGDVETIQEMLESGTDPDTGLTSEDAPDVALSTPLLNACREEHTAAARALLDAGADPGVTDSKGRGALDFVATNGSLPLARLLLSAGADPTVSEAEDLPGLAHENGHTAIADVLHIGSTLLEHDPEFETVGDEGNQGPFEKAFGSTESYSEFLEDAAEVLEEQGRLDESNREPSAFDLLRAVRDGSSARVQELLDKGADPNTTAAGRYLTPLLVATAFGQSDVADLLLQEGAHPAFGLSLGEKTCLMVAATCGEAKIVSSLLEASASMSMRSRGGEPWGNGNREFLGSTALTYAIYGGHVETARAILEKANDVSPDPPARLLPHTEIAGDERTSNNQELLHPAAREGHPEMAKLLLKYGADTTQTDGDGRAPLGVAEAAGSEEVARLLREQEEREEDETRESSQSEESSKPSALDQELIEAALEGNVGKVEQLIDDGANPDVKDDSGAPLIHRCDDTEVLDVLLSAGADPDARDDYYNVDKLRQNREVLGGTRLHLWYKGGVETIDRFLEAGADPNARDSASWATPLFYHVDHVRQESISEELLSLLIEAGADPNAKTNVSYVPLHGARGNLEVTRLLLDAGADPNTPGDHEERDFPLHGERDPEIMVLLLEAGADPNALNRQRLTPLMLAMKWSLGTLEQIECLLENGADPNIQNVEGDAALHLLAENTDPDADFRRKVTSLLLRHGADDYLESAGYTPYEIAERNDNFAVMDALQED